ncbi:WD40 repeat domain-containing protein [Kribbella sp. VKM Ac-2569]|uniref:WD40 repeat domain-containing protein n=1 Tax=Kribbella sp. VKM Ac-2569 TaxID=2512220 RepID=UPI00102B8480|nr:WD40 repeat domain-containing protein [Kribbella sp. VKM Ac-2569]
MHNSLPGFVELPPAASGPDHFLTVLRNADWSAFEPSRDLPPLRTALAELQQEYGVTDAHRFATEQIRSAGAVLRHPDGHLVEIDALALSPCGRYLAVGSWCGDDYDRGGVLQVWELDTGRCVNMLDGVPGGVGWPGYARSIQWSPDGQRVALAFNTNMVGLWDPFGADGEEPIGDASVTDGGSRPPDFAFAPDGTHAYIGMRAPHEVHGCIAPLAAGHFFYNAYDEHGPQPAWLAQTLPAPVKARLGDDELFFEQVFWSRDGSRIYGYSRRNWAASIDVRSGQVVWLDGADTHGQAPAWSLDERLVAVHLDGRLLIADAQTGALVGELPGLPGASLSWGAGGRLAVVLNDHHFPRVVVHDPDGRSHHLHVAPKEADWELPDAGVWAWSPDGEFAACLTSADQIEIWSPGAYPEAVDIFDVPEDISGVLWGGDGVVVAAGRTRLRFIEAATGDVLGEYRFLREPYASRPLELDGDDIGADLRYEEHGDPSFVLDDDTWAAAFAPGLVIAPDDRRDDLDELLAWVLDRRYSWPTWWGELDIVPDAETAAGRLGAPYDDYLEPFVGAPEPAPAETWPPPNTATVDDLFQLALDSVRPLRSGWDHHVSESLRHAARLRARRGEVQGAMDLLAAVPTPAERLRGTADVALILAAAGRLDEARAVFTLTDTDIDAVLDEYNVAFIASSIGGAYTALGDAARGDAWFARARAAIEPETNPGQHRLAVAWALVECGRVDEARAVWQGATTTPSTFYTTPFLAYLVRTGRDDLARELFTLKSTSGMDYVSYSEDGTQEYLGHLEEGWFDGWEGVQVLAGLGRPDLVRDWARVFGDGYAYDDVLERAEVTARDRGPRPAPAEISGLVDEYGTLLKTPRARREHPTQLLVLQAAACRHLGAVLNLIPTLPDDDFNGQPGSAFRALWIAATGVDVEPW